MKVIQMRILMRCKEGAFCSNNNRRAKKRGAKNMKDHNHQNNI